MTYEEQRKAKQLSEGQLWRLKKRYVLIVAAENLCVRFKLMDAPDQTGERTLTGDMDTLWRYLKSRGAVLV
jgi:tricorn protease-like protein